MFRWWDGYGWDDRVRPRLVAAAEDQTRIFNEQTRLLVDMRNDISTIKNVILFWFVITFFGLLAYIIAVNVN